MTVTDSSSESNTEHPSDNAAFVSAHRIAFSTTDAPTAFRPGDRVWILDYYYPGKVRAIGATSGCVVVEAPQWDYEAVAVARGHDGKLALTEFSYGPSDYRMLRVDPASEAFWPARMPWEA